MYRVRIRVRVSILNTGSDPGSDPGSGSGKTISYLAGTGSDTASCSGNPITRPVGKTTTNPKIEKLLPLDMYFSVNFSSTLFIRIMNNRGANFVP